MNITALIVWIVVGVIAGIAEAATAAVVSIWFVAGAAVAGVSALFGAPIWLQAILFITATAGTLAPFRKYLVKKNNKALELDNFAGMVESKTGVITETIPAGGCGQVYIEEDGMYWQARAVNDLDPIEKDTRVVIVKINGTCCIVTKAS